MLSPLRDRLPELKIVMEHITTATGVDYVRSGSENLGATITTHHLMINRTILAGGIRPHYYCLPVAYAAEHFLFMLRALATSGFNRVFLGTDPAPHTDSAKLMPCGCAGDLYGAPNTMSISTMFSRKKTFLINSKGFTSSNGLYFTGCLFDQTLHMIKQDAFPVTYPETVKAGDETVTVFDPGVDLFWRVEINWIKAE